MPKDLPLPPPARRSFEILADTPWIGPEGYDPFWDDIREFEGRADKYDREGSPISLRTWVRLVTWDEEHAHAYRWVAIDEVGPFTVSTVWLGLDHSFFVGPPLIFETMVFGPGARDEQWRYSTEEDALAGHVQVVNEVRLLEVLG